MTSAKSEGLAAPARVAVARLRTQLGRVIRDVARKIAGDAALKDAFATQLCLAMRVRGQRQRQRGKKVYSLHAPEVECIGKGNLVHHALKFARSLDRLGAGPPYAILVSLVRCSGARLVHDFAHPGAIPEDLPCGMLEQDQYALIESIWETLPQDGAEAATALKTSLDHLANAAGLAEAPYFDKAGRSLMSLYRAGR